MKIIVHRGTHQIGGSCLEVATASTRLVLDVGLPLDDLAAPAVIPPQERTDETVSEVFARAPEVAAVLISHAHADHTGLLHLVPPGVPIFLSKGTSKMMLASSVYANQPNVPRERQRVLELRSPHRIGDITVTAFPVDHSAFDAQAFLLEADGQRVLYSGDLRLHGRKPGMARTLIEALHHKLVDALIMDGTHFSEDRQPGLTEMQLEDVIFTDIHSAPGLVLTAFSPMHVDRLVTFYKAARRAGRIFVVDHYAAFIFFLAATQARIPEPKRGAGIQVFLPSRRKRVGKLEALHSANLVYLDEILAKPNRYVMPFRTSMLEGDFAAGLPPAAHCIYSYWHGYLKKPDWQQAQTAFDTCGGEFLVRHTSGHIHAADIVKFVGAVGPRHVIPIHTTRPEKFRRYFPHALLLNDGKAWAVPDSPATVRSPMKPTYQVTDSAREPSPIEKRLFRLANGSWLQTAQTGSIIKVRDFAVPSTSTTYQFPSADLDQRLIGAAEVNLNRGRRYRQFPTRPEPRTAQEQLPQEKAVPEILMSLAAEANAKVLSAKVVPRTYLRRFYEFLTFFHTDARAEIMADFVANGAGGIDSLEKLFAVSVTQCHEYQNTGPLSPARLDEWRQGRINLTDHRPRLAVDLITRLGHMAGAAKVFPVRSKDATALDFTAVSYEANPLRTLKAFFEGDISAHKTGAGGMDLLLCSKDDGLPIIAEVKAPGDKNLFAALVQALTYAAELVTEHQFDRLRGAYGEFAALTVERFPRCDVYIVYFRPDQPGPEWRSARRDGPKLQEQAMKTADLLLGRPDGTVAQRIRRIAFLEVNAEGPPEFECRHLSPSACRAD